MNSLAQMISPSSVAIIGASRREGTLGRMFFDALRKMHYRGKIFPVNPKTDEIEGILCYPDIGHLPETPDLAVILIAKDYVLSAIDDLAGKGVKNIIIVSAGFKETGPDGARLELELTERIHSYGMRMIGPNSMGLFNTDPDVSLNATFSPTPPSPGHVAFISQSGALGVAVLELSRRLGLGFSVFVSTGNKADVGDVDILQFVAGDPNTNVITLYQESIDHSVQFREICQKTVRNKPILVLKAGSTQSGLKAASSHTGALSSDDTLVSAFLHQCGVIRCRSLKELLLSAHAFDQQEIPKGNRVAVITNAGGPGILASDALEGAGLSLPDLSTTTKVKLQNILPAEAAVLNPVDMIASATHDTYRDVCEILNKDSNIDILLLIIVKPPVATTPRLIIENLSGMISKSHKPLFCVLMADTNDESGLEQFQKFNIPVYSYPEEAATVLGNLLRYRRLSNRSPEAKYQIRPQATKGKNKFQAPFAEIMKRLSEFNINYSPFVITSDVHEALSFQKEAGAVALKIINKEIIHKSDHGLVHLNLKTTEQLNHAFTESTQRVRSLLAPEIEAQVLIQKMVNPGVELVLGTLEDPTFGPVIMFGIGGVFVELYKDVTFRILPIRAEDVDEMIQEIRAQKLFTGFRNKPALKKEKIAETILHFARLVEKYHDIVEMDLNPLIIPFDADEPVVVDARMTLI